MRPGEDLLLVVFHHMGSDHLSGGLLFSELDRIYTSLETDSDVELPALPFQYSDYAIWQREQLQGGRLQDLLDYWTGQLTAAPERLELPTDRPRPQTQSYRGVWRAVPIDAAAAAPIRELARSERATVFMALLAGFKAVISRYTGATDMVIGTPVSGRFDERTSSLLGFFSNTLALRTNLSGDPSFSQRWSASVRPRSERSRTRSCRLSALSRTSNPSRARAHTRSSRSCSATTG